MNLKSSVRNLVKDTLVSTVFVSVGCLVSSAQAGSIFWTDPIGSNVPAPNTDLIKTANADGTGIQELVTGIHEPRGMDLDLQNGKMYWMDLGALSVRRANLDGTNIENLVAFDDGSSGITLDVAAGKMYWTHAASSHVVDGLIRKANLDGTQVETLVNLGPLLPLGIAVDTQNAKVYWTEVRDDKIQRANLDGSGVQDVVTGVRSAGIAVDSVGGSIYWIDGLSMAIQRANLDGSNVEDVVVGLDNPTNLDLDLNAGKIYWTDSGAFGKINRIERANLADGSGREVVVSGVGFPWGIAVVPVQPGDYDGDNRVTVFDLNLVLHNWNVDGSALFGPWFNERPPAGTVVGLEHLNAVLFNWGDTVSVATVPEPAAGTLSVWMFVLGLTPVVASGRQSRAASCLERLLYGW